MQTRRSQSKRSKVITLELKMSYYELGDIFARVDQVKSTNSTWQDFVAFVTRAYDEAEEPK